MGENYARSGWSGKGWRIEEEWLTKSGERMEEAQDRIGLTDWLMDEEWNDGRWTEESAM